MVNYDLNNLRRTIVPILERNEHRWFGRDIMFTKEAQDVCYAGVIEGAEVDDIVSQLRAMDNTYPCNLAALKYRWVDGQKIYERASYAHRPDGFRGKWQYHVRLFDYDDDVVVFAHYELNPWHSPYEHYTATHGDTWLPHKGIEWVHEHIEGVDPTAAFDGINE